LNKIAFSHAIVVDFCVEKLQGLGMVSAEILQFYFGEQGGSRDPSRRTAGRRNYFGPS
jgi:hypothetical protein